ncbi:MAG TPA: replicative DNA helicase [Burkholderiaceae bacterium]|nr:replicative DNA helicase [Burkholderiaceae bacterium]
MSAVVTHGPAGDREVASLRLPPHSIEAEQAVLGGVLLDNAAWEKIADLLREEDFYRYDHRLIWQHLARLIERNQPADVLTMQDSLRSTGKLDEAGGLAYLNALATGTPSAANVRRYAEIVRDRSVLRRLVSVSDEIATTALNPQGRDTRQILDEAESKVFQISEDTARTRGGFQDLQAVLTQVVERVDDLYNRENPNDITGVPTGFTDLDKMTSGLQPGDLIIVAARPSVGKTALALNIGEHVAVDQGLPVAVFSMEMGATQLAMRLLCSVGRIDQQRLRTGRLHEEDWPRLTAAIQKMQDAQLFIDETPALNPLELRARARRLARQFGKLGLIVVDYLQLMSATSHGENRATEVAEVSRSMKALAKELNCPVIALSQLSREVEKRNDKRPVMSDLRECVTGDTPVLLADGSSVPIQQLVGRQPRVLAINAAQRIEEADSDLVWSVGVKPVLRLVLASGRTLRATAKHRVLTGRGWLELGTVTPGDRVAIARHLPVPQKPLQWHEHEIILLAHLVGDGSYLCHQPLRYTTASEANSDAVTRAAEAFGCKVQRHEWRGTWHQLVISGNGNRWHPAGVGQWLRGLGVFGQRSHEKQLPRDVFRLGNEQIALLLRHLWATDGCIHVRPLGSVGSARIYFSTCSERLARDVAQLLLRFGIVVRIRSIRQGGHRPLWTIDVSGADQQRMFLQEIGAFGPRIEQAKALQLRLECLKANPNVDTLPQNVFEEVRALMHEQGVTRRQMAALRGYGSAGSLYSPSRSVVAEYARHLQSESLRQQSESDLFWDRVLAVEPGGLEEVFDLTVPGPSSWLADGIVSHNSGALEQDADVILFIHREDRYDPDTANKNMAEIIIGKQRNGPIGSVTLTFLGQYTKFENFAAPGSY